MSTRPDFTRVADPSIKSDNRIKLESEKEVPKRVIQHNASEKTSQKKPSSTRRMVVENEADKRANDASANAQDTNMADGISLAMGSPEYTEFVEDHAPELADGLVAYGGKVDHEVAEDVGAYDYHEEREGGMYDRRVDVERANIQARRAEGYYRNERAAYVENAMKTLEDMPGLYQPEILKELREFEDNPSAREFDEYDGPGARVLKKYM